MAIDARTALVALAIDAAIALAALSLFSVLRLSCPAYYEPRRFFGRDVLQQGVPRADAPLPPALPRVLLMWAVPVLQLPEQRLIASASGLDVAMLRRFTRFALKLLVCLIVWCVGVVLPVNHSGTALAQLAAAQQNLAAAPAPVATPPPAQQPGFLGSLLPVVPSSSSSSSGSSSNSGSGNSSAAGSDGSNGRVQLGPGQDVGSLAEDIAAGRVVATDLDRLTMANIPAGSQLLWLHLASTYIVAAITLRLLLSATSGALQLYQASRSSDAHGGTHTVLVRDIPGVSQGTLLDKVLHNRLFALLPAVFKRRLQAAWQQLTGASSLVAVVTQPLAAAVPASMGALPTAQGPSCRSSSRSAPRRRLTAAISSAPAGPAAVPNGHSEQQQQPSLAGGALADALAASHSGSTAGSSEWKRARAARAGSSCEALQRYVRAEFGVYGRVLAVHAVQHSPAIAALAAQYAATLTALEDLLDLYAAQLQAAVLQAARRQDAYAAAAAAAAVRSTSGISSAAASLCRLLQGPFGARPVLQPIAVKQLPAVQQHASAGKHDKAAAPGTTLAGSSSSGSMLVIADSEASTAESAGSHAAAPDASAQPPDQQQRRLFSWLGRVCCCVRSPQQDALQVLLARLQLLRQKVATAQAQAEQQPQSAAFVTFRLRAALTAALSGRHVAEAGTWRATAAPAPDSVLWGSLAQRSWEQGLRRAGVHAALFLLACFYLLPITAIQGLLQIDRLENVPVLGTLVQLPVVRSVLVGVLPGLVLRLFVLLLPALLYALNRHAGPVGAAELDGHVATHCFVMQVVIVFLGSFITGSLINQLARLIDSPEQVLGVLGTGVPQTSNFFLLYIVFTAFVGHAWALLRPWGLLMTSIRWLAARRRGAAARQRAVVAGTYRMFGPIIPEPSIILLLSLVFSVIAPLVLLAGLCFFAIAALVDGYNFTYVFRRPYDGAGRLWMQLHRHVFVAIYMQQLVMLALFITKRWVWVPLLLPLLAATALAQHISGRMLLQSWQVLSMRTAHELDLADEDAAAAQLSRQRGTAADATSSCNSAADAVFAPAWARLYCPPAQQLLQEADALHASLQQRVAAMQARLAAHNAAAAAERQQPEGASLKLPPV